MIEILPADPDGDEVRRMIDDLDALHNALYPAESNHLDAIEVLQRPNVRFLVARLGTELLGCGAAKLFGRDYAELKRMYVRPEARGKGLGYRLLVALEQQVEDAGISLIRLETGIYQHEALTLYRRAGYRDCPPFADYTEDALSVFLAKSL